MTGVTKQLALSGPAAVFKMVISMEVCTGETHAPNIVFKLTSTYQFSNLFVLTFYPGKQTIISKSNPHNSLKTPQNSKFIARVCLVTQLGEASVKC